jgi:hypothetical protein
MKYTTKNQNEFDNLVAFHLSAFNKWVSEEFKLFNTATLGSEHTNMHVSL